MATTEEELAKAVATLGLSVRGWCVEPLTHPDFTARTLYTIVLIGNLGGSFWTHFKKSGVEGDHALDAWTKRELEPIAEQFNCKALYPSDTPYQPFQHWAKRAEGMKQSPLGLLIHADYGLWQAYRAAFVFDDIWPLREQVVDHPCDHCEAKPCLQTCPVAAFTHAGYDVKSCHAHVAEDRAATCKGGGCLARQACPVGRQYQYSREQQAFHMEAFLSSR